MSCYESAGATGLWIICLLTRHFGKVIGINGDIHHIKENVNEFFTIWQAQATNKQVPRSASELRHVLCNCRVWSPNGLCLLFHHSDTLHPTARSLHDLWASVISGCIETWQLSVASDFSTVCWEWKSHLKVAVEERWTWPYLSQTNYWSVQLQAAHLSASPAPNPRPLVTNSKSSAVIRIIYERWSSPSSLIISLLTPLTACTSFRDYLLLHYWYGN